MNTVKAPRRKVVSSYKPSVGGSQHSHNYFDCTLECGHTVTAYGRRPQGSYKHEAPASCLCFKCRNGTPEANGKAY